MYSEVLCNLMQELNVLLLLCRQRRPTLCRCQTCVVTILMLLILLSMSVSAGLIVTYLQLRKELDVVRNRLVTGAVSLTHRQNCHVIFSMCFVTHTHTCTKHTHSNCSYMQPQYFINIWLQLMTFNILWIRFKTDTDAADKRTECFSCVNE